LKVRLKPDAIVDRIPQPLFAAQIAFRCPYANVPAEELDLLEFASRLMASRAHVRRRSCGATPANPHRPHACLTTPQMTLGLKQAAAIRPALLMAWNTAPSVTRDSLNHS
jgi:hypothetical protein